MAKYTKKVLLELEKLTALVQERRKETRLKELYSHMKSWNSGKLSTEEMEEIAGRFIPFKEEEQQKRVRGASEPALPVASALLEGILDRSEVSAKVLQEIDILMKVMEV